jgi:hypothetical protein
VAWQPRCATDVVDRLDVQEHRVIADALNVTVPVPRPRRERVGHQSSAASAEVPPRVSFRSWRCCHW